jgi:hypothetical protein
MNRVHKPAMIRSAARRLGTFPAAIEDAQLMFDEHRLGNDGTEAARSDQSNQGDNQMNENDDDVAHPRNPIKASITLGIGPIW